MPVTIRPMDRELTNAVEDFLATDYASNIYLLGDLETQDERAIFRIAFSEGRVTGIMVTVEFPDYPVIWIVGDRDSASAFASTINLERFVMITEIDLLELMEETFPGVKAYREDVMILSTSDKVSFPSRGVRKTEPEDHLAWASSLENTDVPSETAVRMAKADLKDSDCFAYFLGERIVSRGLFHIKSSFGWAIGGIYTLPEFRGMGYATNVLSEMVDYARKFTDTIVLFVRSDNYPALSSYRKLGFQTAGSRVFIDRNTGKIP